MLSYRRKKRISAIKRIRDRFGMNVEHEVLVFCSGRNVYAQVINLKSGLTEITVSTCKKGDKKNHKNISTAIDLGKRLAKECENRKISNISFNRAEKIFHGVVKAVVDSFYQK